MAAARAGAAEHQIADRTVVTGASRLLRCFGARSGSALQLLVRRLAIDGLVIRSRDERAHDQCLALLGGDRADLAARRHHERALGNARATLLVEQADERLAHRE